MTQHPETRLVDATCAACGSTFVVRTTAESLSLDVCSNCHPAYTGERRQTAHGDRIDRFNRRRELALV
jgi:large subunit ribosomal protein L31